MSFDLWLFVSLCKSSWAIYRTLKLGFRVKHYGWLVRWEKTHIQSICSGQKFGLLMIPLNVFFQRPTYILNYLKKTRTWNTSWNLFLFHTGSKWYTWAQMCIYTPHLIILIHCPVGAPSVQVWTPVLAWSWRISN